MKKTMGSIRTRRTIAEQQNYFACTILDDVKEMYSLVLWVELPPTFWFKFMFSCY